MSDKTEQPTSKRLREARQKGQIARSKLLSASASIGFGLVALAVTASSAAVELRDYAAQALRSAAAGAPVAAALDLAWQTIARLALPVAAAAFAGALISSGLQVGVLFNLGAVGPKLERLSPAAGMGKLFSRQSLVELGRSLVVALVIVWLAWGALRDGAAAIASLPSLEASSALGLGFDLAKGAAIRAAFLAILLGGLDYLNERLSHLKGLMMTKDEVKREYKESEGDPRHKSKRKALHRALLNGTLSRGVQKATAVVLNPTHVAVALRYDPEEAGAPTIVAKGEGEQAARIRMLARRYKVPMVRDVPLARALVRCDVGDEVPEELYKAAAVVLRHVFETKEAAKASRRAS